LPTCTSQLKKNEATESPADFGWSLSCTPFPKRPNIAANKLTKARKRCRSRSKVSFQEGPCLDTETYSKLLSDRKKCVRATYVTITNPQVIIDIPEQSAVTIKNAIFWSVTGRVLGSQALGAAAAVAFASRMLGSSIAVTMTETILFSVELQLQICSDDFIYPCIARVSIYILPEGNLKAVMHTRRVHNLFGKLWVVNVLLATSLQS